MGKNDNMGVYSYVFRHGRLIFGIKNSFWGLFWSGGGNRGGQTASPQKWAKMTIWVSIPMFLGTGNSFLALRIHFEDYFGQGAATGEGARGANCLPSKMGKNDNMGAYSYVFGHEKLIFGI